MAGPPRPRQSRSPSRQQAVAARRRTIELSSPIARDDADRHARSLTDGRWSEMRRTPPTSGSCGGHPAHHRRSPHSRVGANIATSGRRMLARDEVQQCRTAARYRRPRCRNEARRAARASRCGATATRRTEQPPVAPQKLASCKSSGAGPPSVRSIPWTSFNSSRNRWSNGSSDVAITCIAAAMSSASR